MKNVAVLTEAGHLPSFFVPTPEDLTAQESSPRGGGGGGVLVAAGID